MTSIPHFNKKIGRNEPCPCGSKKKYKKCHGDSDFNQESNPYHFDRQVRSLSPASKCLAPDSLSNECTRGTINAHTVSRSGSLGAIEKDGHVYSYKVSMQSLIKTSGAIHPELTGWRKASTFPGFCGFHDKKLFEPLEDKTFSGTKEQCFLLAYRCVAFEFYAKKYSGQQSKLRQVLAAKSQEMSQLIGDFNLGVELGLNDSNVHKSRYDAVLESKNWNAVHAVLIEFDGVFPIQCACGFFPDEDIYGRSIQEISIGKSTPDVITLVSFSANGISYISFCWLPDSDKSCVNYMTAIQQTPQAHLPAILGSLLLQRSENCHFSPNWYDTLPSEGKKWCAEQIKAGLPFDAMPPPPAANENISYFKSVTINSIKVVG